MNYENLKELRHLLIAALALSMAFAFAEYGILFRENSVFNIHQIFIASLLVVSLGYVTHELAHKIVARRKNIHAEFKLWKVGVYVSLILSIFGIVFAALGSVYLYPRADLWGNKAVITRKINAIISMSGPFVNMILALIFLVISKFLNPVGFYQYVLSLGIQINVWLAIFNMIPLYPLDGSKVFLWDKKIWATIFISFVLIYLFFI